MKRKRVTLILGAGTLLAAFSAMGYVAYLKQQTAELLAARKPPANAERYATLQKALYSSPDAKPPAATELPTKLPEGDPASAPLLAPLKRAEKVFARLSDDINAPGEWQALSDELFSKPVSQWTDADWARLNAFLDTHRDLLAEIRAMAAEDGPLYPLDLSQGYALELPHLAPTRTLARLLRADALARAHAGDMAGAAADLVAGLQLGARIGEEPMLISQLVGSAIDGIVYDAIGEAFPEGQIPLELAAQLAQHMYRGNSSGGFSEAFLEERHMGLDFIEQVMDSEWSDARDMLGPMGVPQSPSWQWSLYSSPLGRPWQHMDAHAYDHIMSGFQDTLGLPYYEARPMIEALTREVEDLPGSRLFTRMQLPSMFDFHQAIAQDQARQQIVQLGIALESHAREHGAYPSELGAIQGQANGASIIDPFTGAPFHYVTNGNGFSLYSVGRDLEDDGGRQGNRDGDIVWRGEETPRPAHGQVTART